MGDGLRGGCRKPRPPGAQRRPQAVEQRVRRGDGLRGAVDRAEQLAHSRRIAAHRGSMHQRAEGLAVGCGWMRAKIRDAPSPDELERVVEHPCRVSRRRKPGQRCLNQPAIEVLSGAEWLPRGECLVPPALCRARHQLVLHTVQTILRRPRGTAKQRRQAVRKPQVGEPKGKVHDECRNGLTANTLQRAEHLCARCVRPKL